jgi:hypothetical protein
MHAQIPITHPKSSFQRCCFYNKRATHIYRASTTDTSYKFPVEDLDEYERPAPPTGPSPNIIAAPVRSYKPTVNSTVIDYSQVDKDDNPMTSKITFRNAQDFPIFSVNDDSSAPTTKGITKWDERQVLLPKQASNNLTEWDLRAKLEKRRRKAREEQAWHDIQSKLVRRKSISADWRTDIRCNNTGDPTQPDYREWTNKEIWNLITTDGLHADPRDVEFLVRNPAGRADWVEEGVDYIPEIDEYLKNKGLMIEEDEEDAIVDQAGENMLEEELEMQEFP